MKLQDVVTRNGTLQMIVSMKIKQNPPHSGRINNTQRNEYLLVLSNRMQNNLNLNNNLNLKHMNFRILGTNVNDLIRNSRCANSDNQDNNQHNRNRNQHNRNRNRNRNQARHSSKSDNQNNNHNNNQAHHSSKSNNQNNNQHNN